MVIMSWLRWRNVLPSFIQIVLLYSTNLLTFVKSTNYYYGMYRSYGTGDTVITTYHGDQYAGSQVPNRKWVVECFDGEAAIGISDNMWDFATLSYVWCKFMFPHKPPSNGLYPYYANCHVQDYTFNFFCYNSKNHSTTVNTFVTGFMDTDFVFWTFSQSDVLQPYKCCRTPPGYYIDYVSCYYLSTHDPYWEYYDGNYFLVNCATGYIMTGIGAKLNPIFPEKRIDWIQCCRVGWGAVIALPPPLIHRPGHPPAYTTSNNVQPVNIPETYRHQYRKKRSIPMHTNAVDILNTSKPLMEDPIGDDEVSQNTVPSTDPHMFSKPFNIQDHDLPITINNPMDMFYHGQGLDG